MFGAATTGTMISEDVALGDGVGLGVFSDEIYFMSKKLLLFGVGVYVGEREVLMECEDLIILATGPQY